MCCARFLLCSVVQQVDLMPERHLVFHLKIREEASIPEGFTALGIFRDAHNCTRIPCTERTQEEVPQGSPTLPASPPQGCKGYEAHVPIGQCCHRTLHFTYLCHLMHLSSIKPANMLHLRSQSHKPLGIPLTSTTTCSGTSSAVSPAVLRDTSTSWPATSTVMRRVAARGPTPPP